MNSKNSVRLYLKYILIFVLECALLSAIYFGFIFYKNHIYREMIGNSEEVDLMSVIENGEGYSYEANVITITEPQAKLVIPMSNKASNADNIGIRIDVNEMSVYELEGRLEGNDNIIKIKSGDNNVECDALQDRDTVTIIFTDKVGTVVNFKGLYTWGY